jgi:hypothetical protein
MSSISTFPLEGEQITQDVDKYFMKLAIRHAQFAFREKEVPIGKLYAAINDNSLEF